MTEPKPRECELWQGADRMARAMAALEEDVPDDRSISAYLAGSRVIVVDDPVIEKAFGSEFLKELNDVSG